MGYGVTIESVRGSNVSLVVLADIDEAYGERAAAEHGVYLTCLDLALGAIGLLLAERSMTRSPTRALDGAPSHLPRRLGALARDLAAAPGGHGATE